MVSVRTCPVCGRKSTSVLFRPKASPGPVMRCMNCGMVYISSIEDSHALIFDGPVGQPDSKILTSCNLDDVSGSWELKLLPRMELERTALQRNAMDALDRIERHIEMSGHERRILDFGSGFGFFLGFAKERGWTTYGLEPLPASAVYARATFGLNVVTDTLREDTFPPGFFKVITSFQVFEHLPFPREDLQHLYNMLQQGGLVLIEVPNFDTWTMQVMRSRHRHFVQDHLNFFSISTLSQLLVDCGFRVIDYYHPTRRMSVRHFVNIWCRKYFPAVMVDSLRNLLQRTRLWEQTFGININDIITVIGRKE